MKFKKSEAENFRNVEENFHNDFHSATFRFR